MSIIHNGKVINRYVFINIAQPYTNQDILRTHGCRKNKELRKLDVPLSIGSTNLQ